MFAKFVCLSLLLGLTFGQNLYGLRVIKAAGAGYNLSFSQINIMTNVSTSHLDFSFDQEDQRPLIFGACYDQDRTTYYFIYNLFNFNLNLTTTYISAINVTTNEFVFQNERFSRPGEYSSWGIDIDAKGNIHYLSTDRSNPEDSFYVAVNYCIWRPEHRKSFVLYYDIGMAGYGGSAAYAVSENQLLVLGGFEDMYTFKPWGYSETIPRNRNVYRQRSLSWNRKTNKGYMLQMTPSPSGIQATMVVSQFVNHTNEYPVVCQINGVPPSETWALNNNGNCLSAVDSENNLFSFISNTARNIYYPDYTAMVTTINLDTCETIWSNLDYNEDSLVGPVFIN